MRSRYPFSLSASDLLEAMPKPWARQFPQIPIFSTSSSEISSDAPVIESGRPGRLVIGHLLRDLELAPILQIRSDPGCPEAVTADLGLDAGTGSSAADHPPDVGLQHGMIRQLAVRARVVRNSGSLRSSPIAAAAM